VRAALIACAFPLVACAATSEERPLSVEHLNPDGLHANPAFSQAIAVSGPRRTVFVGGQNAVNGAGEIVGVGDLAAQSEQVARNVATALGAGGASVADVVKFTIFVVAGQDLRAGYAGFHQAWGVVPAPPTLSVAYVAGLAHPDFLVEVDAIAVVPVSVE
jgi:enamine deaminase RidA (YjgF/YER057c/UK114 family)